MPAKAIANVSSLSTTDKLEEVFSRVGDYPAMQSVKLSAKLSLSAMSKSWRLPSSPGASPNSSVSAKSSISWSCWRRLTPRSNAVNLAEDLFQAGTKTINAKTDNDLSLAAQYLSKAIVEGGIELVLALLDAQRPRRNQISFRPSAT